MKRLACLTIVFIILLTFTGCEVPKGGVIINEEIGSKKFEIEFSKWNNETDCVMPLKQNDEIQIEIICQSGSLSLEICDQKGIRAFTGTGLDKTSFSVKVPSDGDYLITMKGKNASGTIDIENLSR